MKAIKSTAMGVVTGIAVGMIGQQLLSQNKRSLKKRADRMVSRVEEVLENAQNMMFK